MSTRNTTRAPGRGAFGTALLAAVFATLLSEPAIAKATVEPSGRELYLQECAHCHGPDGHGDGPEAASFLRRPRDLRTGFLAVYDDEEIVARVRDGTPLMLEYDPEALRVRLVQVEQISGHVEKLPSIDWARVDEGSALFAERCEICHGPFGKPLPAALLPDGVQKPPRDLWDPRFQQETSDAALIAAVQHGHEAMPAIPGLQGDEQARKLVPFLRLLSPGFELYSYYCAVCHGDDGSGKGVMAADPYRPRVAFDRAWLANKDRDQLRIDVVHMLSKHGQSMPHFREALSDDELRSIVRYLKSAAQPSRKQ